MVDLAAVKMDFRYDDWFSKEPNVGYETLLYDVMIGDSTLFMRADMVEQTWRIVRSRCSTRGAKKGTAVICRFIRREAQDPVKRTVFWRAMANTGARLTASMP